MSSIVIMSLSFSPIWASNLSKVLASSNSEFKEGEIVLSIAPATNYAVIPVKSGMLRKIDYAGVDMPLTHYLGTLGVSGHTAWVGLNIITQLQSKEEIFISAASGSVGLIVGQLAKLKGCRVVRSTGNDEKENL
ncbi:hypothetical protein KP509_25G010300 [Ceratopteris richardii]|uniref:Uncharacterized protein n=1 Tax=Ceratopteris richardii TaxID=49495 RepID=A0A8T2RPZ0_CERRI|nr:hypothetical protein KP509_25G010300 [Ceratopteris richardii]